MINQSKKNDPREWAKWRESGALGVGEAYAFFDCDASRQDIEKAIPYIRKDAITPEGLEVQLHEGISGLKLDETLAEQMQYPDDYRIMSRERMEQGYEPEARPLASMGYALVARQKGVSNEAVAGELGDVMNGLYSELQSPSMFAKEGFFRGAVVYEKNGEYVLRE